MNIHIVEDIKEALQVIIKCPQTDDKVLHLKSYIELFDEKIKAKKVIWRMHGDLSDLQQQKGRALYNGLISVSGKKEHGKWKIRKSFLKWWMSLEWIVR